MKVRISSRVLDYLSGTQAWADELADRPTSLGELSDRSLVAQLMHASPRKDGSIVLDLAWPERDALREFAEAMENAASQNLPDPDALAELNSARALLRNLSKTGGTRT